MRETYPWEGGLFSHLMMNSCLANDLSPLIPRLAPFVLFTFEDSTYILRVDGDLFVAVRAIARAVFLPSISFPLLDLGFQCISNLSSFDQVHHVFRSQVQR